jgi:hypothetical protein
MATLSSISGRMIRSMQSSLRRSMSSSSHRLSTRLSHATKAVLPSNLALTHSRFVVTVPGATVVRRQLNSSVFMNTRSVMCSTIQQCTFSSSAVPKIPMPALKELRAMTDAPLADCKAALNAV